MSPARSGFQLLWLVLTCSRSVSAWLNIFGLPVSGAASVEEGSPLDAWFYFVTDYSGLLCPR